MAKYIEINSISSISPDKTFQVKLTIDNHPEVIYYTVNESVLPYLTLDRIDALVIALLPLAWKLGLDIKSDIPISEELYYNLDFHLLDALKGANPDIHRINIVAPKISILEHQEQKYVATGISCGVDSLHTVYSHSKKFVPDSHAVNALTFFNVGAAMKDGSEGIHSPLVAGRLENAIKFAEEIGLPLFFIESNIHHLINKYITYSHVICNTYINLHCVLLIQRVISKYYYSSGHPYHEFKIDTSNDSSYYDLLTLTMLSYNNMKMISTGGAISRYQKQKELLNYPLSKKYLNVCVDSPTNCGHCFKCTRTLLSIDSLGCLQDYKDVFNIDDYKKHKKEFIERMWINYKFHNDTWLTEVLPLFKDILTPKFKLRCLWHIAKRRIYSK